MEPDRITQAFLSRFSEPIIAEAERLRSAGAVKQIFGGQAFIRARVEESGDVYRVMLKRSVLGWEWELSGPEQQHPAAIAAVMLERVARGESLPDSPNEVGDASLLEVIEEKLGRGLLPMEDLYVEKLEKRYKRYEMEQSLYDTDLVRLNLAETEAGDLDGRRRPARLTDAGLAFEYRIAERLRALLGRAYRTGGLDGVAGTRRILAALAGPRTGVGLRREET